MRERVSSLLQSGHVFGEDERFIANRIKYLNIMILFAFIFVPPAALFGYYSEGVVLPIIYGVTLPLMLVSFYLLRHSKDNYDLAVRIYIITPTIMITAAFFLTSNEIARATIPIFPVVVGYFFLDKKSALFVVMYALGLIAISLGIDQGIAFKDWISTILVIILTSVVFHFYHEMNGELFETINTHNDQLKRLTVTDKLTTLVNRRGIDELFESEMRRFQRFGHSLGVMMIDIDNFKDVNDTLGHDVGDRVLFEVAQSMLGLVRETDILGRWGGEEFVLICPETSFDEMKQLAERVRKGIASMQKNGLPTITVSIGASVVRLDETCSNVLKRVDSYLYKAKEEGKNCVYLKG